MIVQPAGSGRRPDRTLRALGFGTDPITAPLTYPGRVPHTPAVLLLGDRLFEVRAGAEPIGRWPVDGGGTALDEVLASAGAAPMSERHPVLAVGSNASPAQLARKFARAGIRPAVPIIAVRVQGVIAGVSAHVSRPGYLPATPVAADGAVSDLHVTWLDDAELEAVDATEPNYHRVLLPACHTVTCVAGGVVAGCRSYVSRHGHLLDRSGAPRRLTGQRDLIAALIADIPALASAAGPDPESFVAAVSADPDLRARVRDLIHGAGLAHPSISTHRDADGTGPVIRTRRHATDRPDAAMARGLGSADAFVT